MKIVKAIAAIVMATGLTACAAVPNVSLQKPPFEEVVSQSANGAANLLPVGLGSTRVNPTNLRVADIRVSVPNSLTVSEENLYYPIADIVWRGEATGDRRAQVRSIFETAFTYGTKGFQGNHPVVLDVEVTRFHSVSEKARYTVGGVHNIEFYLTVRDARTGVALVPRRHLEKNLNAHGGQQAIAADKRGETQKVRVVSFLAHVIAQEMYNGSGNRSKKKTRKHEPGT